MVVYWDHRGSESFLLLRVNSFVFFVCDLKWFYLCLCVCVCVRACKTKINPTRSAILIVSNVFVCTRGPCIKTQSVRPQS